MTQDRERRQQRFYDRGREDSNGRAWMVETERSSLATTDPDYLAAYDAGRDGGPRPPLSADFVIDEIRGHVSAILSRSDTPRVVRIGKLQDAALGKGGYTGMQLVVSAPKTGSIPGHTYPSSQFVEVTLRIERVDADTLLEVA